MAYPCDFLRKTVKTVKYAHWYPLSTVLTVFAQKWLGYAKTGFEGRKSVKDDLSVRLGGDDSSRRNASEVDLIGEKLAEFVLIGILILIANADDRVGGAVTFGDDRGAEGLGYGEGFFEVLSDLVDGKEGFRVDGEGGFGHGGFPF